MNSSRERTSLQTFFLLFLLLGTMGLVFIMFRPYLSALLLALTFSIIFSSVHTRVLRIFGNRESLAAFLTVLIILLVVLLPLFFISAQIFEEAQGLYHSLSSNGNGDILNTLTQKVEGFLGKFAPGIKVDIEAVGRESLRWISQNIDSVFSSFVKTLLNLFITIVALFYFLRDGARFRKAIIRISPLPSSEDIVILDKLEATVNSVIRGSIMIAIIQGILSGLGFVLFGVPNAVLFGTAATLAALIPGVGTSLVLIPSILYLFMLGNITHAVGLLIWGTLMVGLIDNFLSPIIIERGIKVHPLLILLSVLGGIGFFGPIGFILGPLVLSFLAVLINIYLLRINRKSIRSSP